MLSSTVALKLVMLSIMFALTRKAFIPPTKEISSDKIETSSFTNKYIHLLAKYGIMPAFLVPSFVQGCVILLRTISISSTSPLSKTFKLADTCSRDDNELYRLSPLFWSIFLLTAGGASLRLLCFKTLGRFFTFSVTIRSNHTVIDVGPYGIVRHPSYAGGYIMYAGAVLWAFSSQNPAITCGWASSSLLVRLILGLWVFIGGFLCFCIMRRVSVEEKNLQTHFGKSWDDYVKRVPYQYFPGIY